MKRDRYFFITIMMFVLMSIFTAAHANSFRYLVNGCTNATYCTLQQLIESKNVFYAKTLNTTSGNLSSYLSWQDFYGSPSSATYIQTKVQLVGLSPNEIFEALYRFAGTTPLSGLELTYRFSVVSDITDPTKLADSYIHQAGVEVAESGWCYDATVPVDSVSADAIGVGNVSLTAIADNILAGNGFNCPNVRVP